MRKIYYPFILLLLMTACTNNNNVQEKNADVMPQGVSVKDSHLNMADRTDYTNEQRADYLAKLASDIPNVYNATAVVLGNIAVVGIDVDKNMDRSKVGTIKYSVAESLKHDPLGAGALVVAGPDITSRLRGVQSDIAAGRPIQGIMDELSDIVGRLMPEIPQVEDGRNPQEATEKPKREMDQHEDQELEKVQEEQSNHHK